MPEAPQEKRGRGAPKGNRHALKTGCHTAEMRALLLRARLQVAELKMAASMVRLEAARIEQRTAEMKRAQS